jgi:hypothetical protein
MNESWSLKAERWGPAIGTIGVTLAWFFLLGAPFPTSKDNLLSASATVASIFASFLGVAAAIILSIKGSPTYNVLIKLGYVSIMINYLKSAVIYAVLFAIISMSGFFIEHRILIGSADISLIYRVIWVLSGTQAAFTYMRITSILFKLLNQ